MKNKFSFIIFGLLITQMVLAKNNLQQCIDLFNAKKHTQLIKTCSDKKDESIDIEFMLLATQLFLEVSYDRINEIFYNGKQFGSFVYKHKTGKNLYTQLERHHLKTYFKDISEYANAGIPLARLLTAKIYYINEDIIKRGEMPETNQAYYEAFDSGMNEFYFPNLKQLVKDNPNHREALAMLGFESFTSEYIPDDKNPNQRYFRIKNEEFYSYLLRAHELGHPGFDVVINGVAKWNEHVNALKVKANLQDPESIYQLGNQARIKGHEDPKLMKVAFDHFKKASELGHLGALHGLKNMYLEKEFYDFQKYLGALEELAERGDSRSYIRLGDIYLCNKRTDEAKKYYLKAMDLNDPEAKFALDDLKYDGVPSSGC